MTVSHKRKAPVRAMPVSKPRSSRRSSTYTYSARKRKRSSRASGSRVTLKKRVQQRLEQFDTEKDALQARVRALESTLAEMPHTRGTLRRRKEVQQELDDTLQRVRALDCGIIQEQFKKRVVPYLHAAEQQQEIDHAASVPSSLTVASVSTAIMQHVRVTKTNHSSSIYNECLINVFNDDDVYPDMQVNQEENCVTCAQPMKVIPEKSELQCMTCGYTVNYLDATSSSMAYGEEVEFASFSYRRINHFNNRLNLLQAKETFEVPQHVIKDVIKRLRDKRVRPQDLNKSIVKQNIRQTAMRKYAQQILTKISGIPPPRMTIEQEEKCRLMFMAIQKPFERHKPKGRTNFLSYGYCIFKICELLGYHEFLPYLPLLKGDDKLQKQDAIFEKICKDLDWEFVPSKRMPVF